MSEEVYVGFGSNQGAAVPQFREALRGLVEGAQVTLVALSSLYRTEPVGLEDQDWFVNGVAGVRCALSPADLMARLMEIETRLERRREIPGGPRTMDLDILFYGNQVVREGQLRIPHPSLHRRRFVLVPLCEIAPDFRHPELEMTVRELLDALDDDKRVEPLGPWEAGPC